MFWEVIKIPGRKLKRKRDEKAGRFAPDTNTLPTEEMKEAAFRSPLGDAVYGEDQGKRAGGISCLYSGKRKSNFPPSGTMGNLVALLTHTQRGNEIILEEECHIFTSETGGLAQVAGLMVKTLRSEDGAPTSGY